MTNQTQQPGLIISLTAQGDILPNRCIGANGGHAQAGSMIAGISQQATSSGKSMAVAVDGALLVEAGGVIATGDDISSDAQGRAVKATTGKVVGLSLGNAALAGSLVRVVLR